jgi:tetratricopeptide (TPR) repeat protein
MRSIVIMLVLGLTAGRVVAQAEDDLREGDRYFEEGDWKRAAAAFDRAIRKYPTQVPATAFGKRAAIYIINKDYPGGLTFLRDVAKKRWPDAPEVLEQEALILWQVGNKTDAVAVAEKVVEKKPGAFTNQNLIGEFYAGKDADKTAKAYEAYLANRPNDLEQGDVLPRIRLGFAYLSQARGAIKNNQGDDAAALYAKAAGQLETVEKKFGKKANAAVNADNGLCAAYTGMRKHDQAITVCERIIQDPRKIDPNGSVWFNLGTAYLAKRQPQKARTAATEYIRARKGEARGHILIGDAYFQERDWPRALQSYLEADKLVKPTQQREQVTVSIKLGKTYRRMPTAQNLTLAVQKLEGGYQSNPGSIDLVLELGSAYLAAKQDARAEQLVDKALKQDEVAKAPDDVRAGLLLVAAKAQYNQGKLKEARSGLESVRQTRPKDVDVTRSLVAVISAQAYAAFEKKDTKGAQALYEQALLVDATAAIPITALASLAIDRDDCAGALALLGKLGSASGSDALVAKRLEARSYMCLPKPDAKRANEAYADAEKTAKSQQANLVLAEVYTEWAPLTWNGDLEGAIEKLTTAVQLAGNSAGVGPAAKRNLAIALFRRGWKQMRDGKAGAAFDDFDRATKDTSLLEGVEPLAFEFSRSLALLEKGEAGAAAKAFKALAGKGNQASYLKAPYAKLGGQFFSAYASYKSGTLAGRTSAASDFASMQGGATGAFKNKLEQLLGSAYEMIAYDQWKAGKQSAASSALTSAGKYADADAKKRVTNNKAVLNMNKSDIGTFEGLGASPPEALVNLGILLDQAGKPKDAYEAWVKAKAKGANARDLQKWIEAKKRIYGF